MTTVCGHRGACGSAPENTLAAFRQAKELGATWIEFDVQLSADSVPIIFHDDTLERTTNLARQLRPTDLTLAELKQLDAGSWFGPEWTGETIPTLDEVLGQFGGSLGLNIEIKSEAGFETDNGIERLVAQAVRRYNLQDEALLSSFDPTRLERLRRYDPDLRLGVLFEHREFRNDPTFDPFKIAQSLGAVAVHPHFTQVNPALVGRARSQGLAINTWTVNEISDAQRLVSLGVDMLITNYPERLVSFLSQKQ